MALTDALGSFYLCYQYPPGEKGSECSDVTSVSSTESSSITTSTTGSVNYTVCCFHGAYSVHCSYSVATNGGGTGILFSLFNDYLVVFLPGCFLHLLDVSCRHEPVHNLLLHVDMGLLPELPLSGNSPPLLSTIPLHSNRGSKLDTCCTIIMDNNSTKCYTLELSTQGLLKYFLLVKPPTRLAILHAATVHFNLKRFTQEILKRACQDSANVETTDIF